MFRIVRNGDVELQADILETSLGKIEQGQPATLSVAGVGKVEGHVRLAPPDVDPQTRLGRALIEVDGWLRPGLFASGDIVVDRRQNLALPASAVLSDENGDRIMVVNDGQMQARTVTPGLLQDGMREMRSGVNPDDIVVAKAGAFFQDGDRVRTVRQQQKAAGNVGGVAGPRTQSSDGNSAGAE